MIDPQRCGCRINARYLHDRLPGLTHDRNRTRAELRIKPTSHLSHEPLCPNTGLYIGMGIVEIITLQSSFRKLG